MKRRLSLVLMVILIMSALVACGGTNADDKGASKTLRLAHNMSEDHPIHKALVSFSESVEEKTNGTIKFNISSNGILGSETEVLEQLQNGSVDITKVSAGALESFSEDYSVFSIPYIFTSDDHYRAVMESDLPESIYKSTEDKGFIGLSYYDSGARSFYTKDQAIETPDDLKGLLLRVMDSKTAIDMVKLLGGTPTPLAYNEIYTALQQGVIDGAESNPTALTTGQHGEVAKAFSFTEHTNIPDIIVINTKTWEGLTEDEQKAFQEAADESRVEHTKLWETAIEEAIEEAKGMGVKFNEVDKTPFIEKVQPIHEKYSENERMAELIEGIKELDN